MNVLMKLSTTTQFMQTLPAHGVMSVFKPAARSTKFLALSRWGALDTDDRTVARWAV